MSFIEFKEVTKRYQDGDSIILANNEVNFTIEEGEFAIIVGPSGAGKSTTLNILGGIDSNDDGQVVVAQENISDYNESELTRYRRYQIGFVFQAYNLIGNLTARENVEMATQLVPEAMDPDDALEAVGLGKRMNNFPSQLSGGEQQRVSIARGLAKKPAILLCDEPTGALDYETGRSILKLLHDTSRDFRTTVIIVTHNSAIRPIADRVIEMADGKVRRILKNDQPAPIEEIQW